MGSEPSEKEKRKRALLDHCHHRSFSNVFAGQAMRVVVLDVVVFVAESLAWGFVVSIVDPMAMVFLDDCYSRIFGFDVGYKAEQA